LGNYNDYVNEQIKTRKIIIADRYKVFKWGLDPRLPSYIQEKMDEIKNMFVMGLDNFSIKVIAIFIEEVLQHMVIASEAVYLEDYKKLLDEYKRKSGHHFLKILKEKNLIHEDDYKFCSRYCNDYNHGGERIRNIELHNLMSEKIEKFTLREEVKQNIGDFGIQFLEKVIKGNPTFSHIGARDMNSRGLMDEMASLNDLVNRNVELLQKLNNLKQKSEVELPRSNQFFITIKTTHPSEKIMEILIPIKFIKNSSVIPNKEPSLNDYYTFKLETKYEMDALNLMQGIYDMKKHNFELVQTKVIE
jgi:hypothetical protein